MLSRWSVSPARASEPAVRVTAQRQFTDDGNRYEGAVADGQLTSTGPARFQYELDDDGKIKVNPDGTISVAWWLRD